MGFCVATYFTMVYAKEHITSTVQDSGAPQGEMMTPPTNTDTTDDTTTNAPTMPSGEQGSMQLGGEQMGIGMNSKVSLTIIYYVVFGVESLFISVLILYLVMSKFNKKGFKETFYNSDKVVICILFAIVITGGLVVLDSYLTNKFFLNVDSSANSGMPNEEDTEKETSGDDVDAGTEISDKDIVLDDYSSNVTITEAGEYTLTGSLAYAVLVNANGDVVLNLNGVTVKSGVTAAIANISSNQLTINLVDGSNNSLSDGGSSEYDGCIYSIGKLVINGDGFLSVYGNQSNGEGIATETNDITINAGNIHIESSDDGINAGGDGGTITINGGDIYIKASGDGIDSNGDLVINGGTIYSMGSSTGGDAGIDTDGGFAINGGFVIALGSDMLESPLDSSKQYSISFNLDSAIESGTLITLLDGDGNVIVSFEANEAFSTLIISSDSIADDTYYLYRDGTNSGVLMNGIYTGGEYTKGTVVSVSGSSSFSVSSVVTKVGVSSMSR